MEGILVQPKSYIQDALDVELDLLRALRNMGPDCRNVLYCDGLKWEGGRKWTIRALRECAKLARKFKVVTLDETATRSRHSTCRNIHGYTYTVEFKHPLIWTAKLPCSDRMEMMVFADGRGDSLKLTAKTPPPPPEALKAMKLHGKKFDHLEVWWVPNDVLVEKMPDPDPLLVGVKKVEGYDPFYFELHRWVDETVESGWWSREGY